MMKISLVLLILTFAACAFVRADDEPVNTDSIQADEQEEEPLERGLAEAENNEANEEGDEAEEADEEDEGMEMRSEDDVDDEEDDRADVESRAKKPPTKPKRPLVRTYGCCSKKFVVRRYRGCILLRPLRLRAVCKRRNAPCIREIFLKKRILQRGRCQRVVKRVLVRAICRRIKPRISLVIRRFPVRVTRCACVRPRKG